MLNEQDDVVVSVSVVQNSHSEKPCMYWLSKKNRYCLTPPCDGLNYCPVHCSEKFVTQFNGSDRLGEEQKNTLTAKADPVEETCKFWLQRKNRFCKATPKPGIAYCIAHATEMKVELERPRMPCPYDPNHSCYSDQVDGHLKRCNSRPSLRPVCFQKDINQGTCSDPDVEIKLQDVSTEELNGLINKLKSLHAEYLSDINTSIKTHDVFTTALQDPSNGSVALKHLLQQASLVGNMRDLDFLTNATTYIEFGAGKGGLSHWVQLANQNEDCKFLLIERSSVRYKKDSYHKGADQGPNFERLKIDIGDLVLEKVPACQDSPNEIIGIGKHLCGGATDLMLRCLMKSKDSLKLKGIVLALCCHHRCCWNSYVGQEWFLKHNFTLRDFKILTKISAWATCGMKHSTVQETVIEDMETDYNHQRYGSLTTEEREEIGFMSKNLIDLGRIEYLKRNNFSANLMEYVTKRTTLENFAIVAKSFKTQE